MSYTSSFSPATLPEETVESGAYSYPFTGETINTGGAPATDTQIIELSMSVDWASDPTLTNPGSTYYQKLASPPSPPNTYLISNSTIANSWYEDNEDLSYLFFSPPTLQDGQSIQDTLTLVTQSYTLAGNADSNLATLPVVVDIVTPPAITGTLTSQDDNNAAISPFNTTLITDTDFVNTAMDTATITVDDPIGTPTDADGLLTGGTWLTKNGVGTYSIAAATPGELTSDLASLTFSPVVGKTSTTTTLSLTVTDTQSNLEHDLANVVTTTVFTPGMTPLSPPAITGVVANESDADTAIKPFAGVTVTDAESGVISGAMDTATIMITGSGGTPTDADGTLAGTGLTKTAGTVGTYSEAAATPGSLTTDLAGLVFTPIVGTSATIATLSLSATDTVDGLASNTEMTNVTTPPPPPPPPPTIAGAVAGQNDANAANNPFSGVTVTDKETGTTDNATITITGASGTPTDGDGTLAGTGLTQTGAGTYAVSAATPGALTADLDGLKFTPVVGGSSATATFTLGVTDTVDGLSASDDTTTVTTPGTPSTISPALTVFDTTTGQQLGTLPPATPDQTAYSGPVADLENQYINITPDSINITANTPDWFIQGGSGENALEVTSGTNVINGGDGSNFEVGGTASGEFDTFFVDDRVATQPIWSTIVNMVAGDNATVWGITPSMFDITVADGQGAAGYTGLTIHATAPGSQEASLTLAGYTSAALNNGTLTESFGVDPASGSPYMLIHANT